MIYYKSFLTDRKINRNSNFGKFWQVGVQLARPTGFDANRKICHGAHKDNKNSSTQVVRQNYIFLITESTCTQTFLTD